MSPESSLSSPSPATPEKTHSKSSGYRPDIDGLRALAVFAVFFFHAFPEVVRGGFIGVDVFFVISGFLISSIIFTQLENGSFSFWQFYSRRIRRIYPVLITVLVACLAFGALFLLSHGLFSVYFMLNGEYAQLGKHVAGGAGFISNILLWFESGYFDKTAEAKPLLHLWSLGIEEQFYIVWPLLLWLAWRKRFNFFAVSALFAVVSFGLNLYVYRIDPVADFFSPLTRFWELLAGAMLAWAFLHPGSSPFIWKADSSGPVPVIGLLRKHERLRHILSMTGGLLLAVSVFFVRNTDTEGYPGAWALFPVLSAVLLIAAGKDGWFNKRILSRRILVWFGLISYPLYLWHWPLLSMARIVLRDEPPLWWRIAAFPASVLLAWLTTKLIENPLRFGKYGNIKTVCLFAVMLCLGLTGFVIFKKDGFRSTLPYMARTLENVLEKRGKTNPAFYNGCHQDSYDKYGECPHRTSHPSKPTIAIWGDSHAAHLVTGFEQNFGDRFNILQRTGDTCPAILSGKQTQCLKKNQAVLKEFARIRPDYVVLAGFWHSLPSLDNTIAELRKNGMEHIAVVGPVPVWKRELPIELIRAYQKDTVLPDRIRMEERKFARIDKAMSEQSKVWQVHYISPVRFLCNRQGCLARIGDSADRILYFDTDHLTEAGSGYLVYLVRNDPFFRRERRDFARHESGAENAAGNL